MRWDDLRPVAQVEAPEEQEARLAGNLEGLRGALSGIAGMPSDLAWLIKQGARIKANPSAIFTMDDMKDQPLTSDWIGEKLGADIDNPLFMLGSMAGLPPAGNAAAKVPGAAKQAVKEVNTLRKALPTSHLFPIDYAQPALTGKDAKNIQQRKELARALTKGVDPNELTVDEQIELARDVSQKTGLQVIPENEQWGIFWETDDSKAIFEPNALTDEYQPLSNIYKNPEVEQILGYHGDKANLSRKGLDRMNVRADPNLPPDIAGSFDPNAAKQAAKEAFDAGDRDAFLAATEELGNIDHNPAHGDRFFENIFHESEHGIQEATGQWQGGNTDLFRGRGTRLGNAKDGAYASYIRDISNFAGAELSGMRPEAYLKRVLNTFGDPDNVKKLEANGVPRDVQEDVLKSLAQNIDMMDDPDDMYSVRSGVYEFHRENQLPVVQYLNMLGEKNARGVPLRADMTRAERDNIPFIETTYYDDEHGGWVDRPELMGYRQGGQHSVNNQKGSMFDD